MAVLEALRGTRLLIPLVAELGDSSVGVHGQRVDKSADLAIVAVSTPDGKTAIPAFSSVSEMTKWNSTARPVPVPAVKAALAAASDGHERLVIDPASRALVVRRPALAALAQEQAWTPAHLNPRVRELVASAIKTISEIQRFELLNGDPKGILAGPELIIELGLAPGLEPTGLSRLLTQFAGELQTQDFLNLVDSVAFRVREA